MEIVVYISNEADGLALRRLEQALPVRGVNLADPAHREIPAEVLQVMMLKKEESLPLTTVGGHPVLSGRLPTAEEVGRYTREGATAPAVLLTKAKSAVDFPTERRIHISLDVRDVKTSIAFYRIFFGQEPVKVRSDYAKFELLEPPVNFTLNEHVMEGRSTVGHFGIQVKDSDAILLAKERYEKAGFIIEEETSTACCYAVQTKIWVADPDGNRWEIFLVTEAEAEEGCGPDCICYKEMPRSIVNQ